MNTLGYLLCALAVGVGASVASAAPSAGEHNLYLAGGSVVTPAAVAGDFVAVGGRVSVEHAVGGDATLAGGSVRVAAPVGDDLRAAGGDVSVASSIGGELYAAAGNLVLTPAASVARDASLAAGTLVIDGKVGGRLAAAARRIVLNGEVGGDARLRGEHIEIGPQARIQGVLDYRATQPLVKAPQASLGGLVEGAIDDDEAQDWRRERHARGGMGMRHAGPGSVVGLVALLLLSALVVLLAPRLPVRLRDAVAAAPWRVFVGGVAALLGVPLLALLLMATLLGLPLGMTLLMLYPPLLLAGCIAGVLFVAQRLHAALRPQAEPTRLSALGFVALVLLALALLGAWPPLGALAVLGLAVAGLGAVAQLLLGAGRRSPA